MAFLEIDNLSKRFGGLQAIRDVTFSVREGMIKAVIGPNGAGKTTLFNMISGFLAPDSGTVRFRGQPVQGMSPFRIAGEGVSRTFQHIRLFPRMSALENIMVGRHVKGRSGFLSGMLNLPWTWREEQEFQERARAVMAFLEIAPLADMDATSLSYGQQRSVELARALASDPALLLLDEPAAGLNMRETTDLARVIKRIRERGVTVLIVEHDMSLVMDISDEIAVLSYGEKIADDGPLAVQRDPHVIRVYLGEDEC